MMDLVSEAIIFAVKAHDGMRRRKGDELPGNQRGIPPEHPAEAGTPGQSRAGHKGLLQ